MLKKITNRLLGKCKKCFWGDHGKCDDDECIFISYNDCAHLFRIADSGKEEDGCKRREIRKTRR